MYGAHNLILSKHLPDQAAIDEYVIPSADGGIDIKSVPNDSDVMLSIKWVMVLMIVLQAPLLLEMNRSHHSLPDFTMNTVRDTLGSKPHDDGLAQIFLRYMLILLQHLI